LNAEFQGRNVVHSPILPEFGGRRKRSETVGSNTVWSGHFASLRFRSPGIHDFAGITRVCVVFFRNLAILILALQMPFLFLAGTAQDAREKIFARNSARSLQEILPASTWTAQQGE